jgi:hypothetical protein
MSRNGAGTYTLPAGNPVVTGTTISSTWANNTLSDIATALTQSLAKDGQTVPTANIPMGGFKLTGLGAPTVAGDALAFGSSLGAVTATTGTFSGAVSATTGTFSGNVQMASANGSCLAGLRNRVINGGFSVNQRGVSGTVTLAAGAYGHDRWKGGASGCTYTFATSANVTTLTISAGSLIQVIEGINLETGTYCLSFSGTATAKIGAGSLSASGVTGSITGGTNTNIEISTGTISKVQLELSPIPTTFESTRPYGMEIGLCYRYYYKQFPGVASYKFCIGGSSSTVTGVGIMPFPVQMRVIPALEQTGTANQYQVNQFTGAITCSAVPTVSAQYMSLNYGGLAFTVASGLTVGNAVALQADATNGATAFIAWNAEL